MKRLDCNQINIFIKLEIIEEEEDKNKNIYIFFFKSEEKKFCNLVQPLSATMTSKPNFY